MATLPLTLDDLRTAGLADIDPEVAALLERDSSGSAARSS